MKLNKREREKIVKLLKTNEYIQERLKEESCYEDVTDERDILKDGDVLLISYFADGCFETEYMPGTYITPGERTEKLEYSIYIDSIEWFIPNDEDDRSLFVDDASIKEINKCLKELCDENVYFD